MSDPAQYQAYSFRPTKATAAGNVLTVEGAIQWRLAPELEPWGHLNGPWAAKGYKSGLAIGADQTITEFWYRGESGNPIKMVPSPADPPVLVQTYGTQDGYQWVAFTSPPNPELRKHSIRNDTIEFTVMKLEISPKRPNAQLIAVASRHANGSFADGSTASLWVLPFAP
jgi:hypothetical protein